jgi:ATP-dependent RNA helicase DDX3X
LTWVSRFVVSNVFILFVLQARVIVQPQIRRIVQESDMPDKSLRQTFLFSATFPTEIQTLAREFLREYVWIGVGRVGSTVDNIKQNILLSSSDPGLKLQLLSEAIHLTDGRTLVFVQRKKTATWVCNFLTRQLNVAAEEIHGDRTQQQRENALRLFRDGRVRILVATDVAARGLDIPEVLHVIQFDLPISSEDFDTYVHRMGRTGRLGKQGLATAFFVPGRETGEGNGKIAPLIFRLLRETQQVVISNMFSCGVHEIVTIWFA